MEGPVSVRLSIRPSIHPSSIIHLILVPFGMPALGSPYLPGPLVGSEDSGGTKTGLSSRS